MNSNLQRISEAARQAVRTKNWQQVKVGARDILSRDRDSAEGYFLLGLAEKAANRIDQAVRAFTRALNLDENRYDAAIELADLYLQLFRHGEAVALIQNHEPLLYDSPLYLDMAATIYVNAGLPDKGWPLYRRANELQPNVSSLQARLAACCVFVGEIDTAIDIYQTLLSRNPEHQRNHHELSKLRRATDRSHIVQMTALLRPGKQRPDRNIYAYYALGKELEDLEQWDEAFEYFKKAGDAAASIANYDVTTDIELVEKIIGLCDENWMTDKPMRAASSGFEKTPIFIVGLPRTGTTLTERILASHSEVGSVGETYFMQVVLKQESSVRSADSMNGEIIESAARNDISRIARGYLDAVAYKLGDEPAFVEKFPENFTYLGFIAKAFPNCRIIHLNRHPMDACFAMFKQSFFRYAYSLDDLARYYVAYNRLHEHWTGLLGDRIVEVDYESIVSDPEGEIRRLLEVLGLDFESACLNFEENSAASDTASSVQVREKIHTRSLNRWRRYQTQLGSLRSHLENAGINVANGD